MNQNPHNVNNECAIKVYSRVRPSAPSAQQQHGNNFRIPELPLPNFINDEVLRVDHTNKAIILNTKQPRTFAFDGVFGPESTQDEVFELIGRSMVSQVLQGYNGSIYCFGQTGAGKTYTMQGPEAPSRKKDEGWGLLPRIIDNIFLHAPNEDKCLFRISYLEIYKEQITDLLDVENTGLQIREDFKRGVFVEHLNECTVWSLQEAMAVVRKGIQNRHVAATQMNERSSRSHAVFTFSVETQKTDARGVTATKIGKLNLVDLAGSERCSEDCHRVREAGAINRSLSTLTSVILQLSLKNRRKHIHYRDSKLTFLLRESLGGNSKTAICANISALPSCFGETLSTLKFTQRAKNIKTNAVLNEEYSGTVESLNLEVKELRQQLQQLTKVQASLQSASLDPNGQAKVIEDSSSLLGQSFQARRISEIKRAKLEAYCKFLEETNARKDEYVHALRMHSTLLRSLAEYDVPALDFSAMLGECPLPLPEMLQHAPPGIRQVAQDLGKNFTQDFLSEKFAAAQNKTIPCDIPLTPTDAFFENVQKEVAGDGTKSEISLLKEENAILRMAVENHPEVYRLQAENRILRERCGQWESQMAEKKKDAACSGAPGTEGTETSIIPLECDDLISGQMLPTGRSDDSTTIPDGDGKEPEDTENDSSRLFQSVSHAFLTAQEENLALEMEHKEKDRVLLGDLLQAVDAASDVVSRLVNSNDNRLLTAELEEKSENSLKNSLLASLNTMKPKPKKFLLQSPSLGALTRNKSTLSLHSVDTMNPLQTIHDLSQFATPAVSSGQPIETMNLPRANAVASGAPMEPMNAPRSATNRHISQMVSPTLPHAQSLPFVQMNTFASASSTAPVRPVSDNIKNDIRRLVYLEQRQPKSCSNLHEQRRHSALIPEGVWENGEVQASLQPEPLVLENTTPLTPYYNEDFRHHLVSPSILSSVNAVNHHGLLKDAVNRCRHMLEFLVEAIGQKVHISEEFEQLVEKYDNRIEECRFWELQAHRLNLHCAGLEDFARKIKGMHIPPHKERSYSFTSLHCEEMWNERMKSFKELQTYETLNPSIPENQHLDTQEFPEVPENNIFPGFEGNKDKLFVSSSSSSSMGELRGDEGATPLRIVNLHDEEFESLSSSMSVELQGEVHLGADAGIETESSNATKASTNCVSKVQSRNVRRSEFVYSPTDIREERKQFGVTQHVLKDRRCSEPIHSVKEDIRKFSNASTATAKSRIKQPKSLLPKNRKEKRKSFDRGHFLALANDKGAGPNAAIEYLLGTTGGIDFDKKR